MNKEITKVINIAIIYILIILATGVIGTYLSDYLVMVDWFGDAKPICRILGDHNHKGRLDFQQINYVRNGICKFDYIPKWGARHYWYNFGVAILVIASVS